jgi:hypothetical protein
MPKTANAFFIKDIPLNLLDVSPYTGLIPV